MKVTVGYVDGSIAIYNMPITKEQATEAMKDPKALLQGEFETGWRGGYIIVNVSYIMWMKLE